MNPIAELSRRLDNLILLGTIAEIDLDRALCRVESGGLLTAWLPWFSRRAGGTSDWDPPTIGEQCIVLSPSGESAAGFVLVGLYSDANPAPSNSSTLWRRVFSDGAVIEYDHAEHLLTAQLPDGGSAVVLVPDGLSVIGDVTITGSMSISEDVSVSGAVTAGEDVIAAGVSLVHHKTPNIQRGLDLSDEPQ